MKKECLSVVTPVFNEASTVKRAVKSAFSLAYPRHGKVPSKISPLWPNLLVLKTLYRAYVSACNLKEVK